ncbi:MAG: ATP synthase F0 subunit B [Oscillospiraceae bacterium]|jgi:F-type H+-transporting ATPase subunit b|nr:ATP synthase F0 subunit B [Oscillospiraceae bacterium]
MLEQLNLHLEDIPLHILNMIILFVILRQLLYKPVRKFMAERKARLDASLTEAEEAQQQAERLRTEYENRIAAAEETARERAVEITAAANEAAKSMKDSALEESAALLRKAREAAAQEHSKALANVQGDVVDISVAIAQQILRREVCHEDALKLTESYFAALAQGEKD